jgi:succinate dehydrogenase/fumarate reductase flavoprotein subunit
MTGTPTSRHTPDILRCGEIWSLRHGANAHTKWDEEADVVIVGYGFAGSAAAIAAHDAGAKVLLLEKAPEADKGGNSRVSGQIVFWPNDIEKAKTYFKALTGPYMDNISEEMVDVWATEMHANRAWLEAPLGMNPLDIGPAEFPEFEGSDCVEMLVHNDTVDVQRSPASYTNTQLRMKNSPVGGERLWKCVTEPTLATPRIRALYETAAVSLLKDDGEIVGVLADRKGNRIAIKTARGVVLACGGFENNPAMIHTCLYTRWGNTGDGVRMGIEVGADLWHMATSPVRSSSSRRRRFRFRAGSIRRTRTATCLWPATARASWPKAMPPREPTATARSGIMERGCSSRLRSRFI